MAEPGKRRATPALISLIRPIGINCMQTYVSRPPSSSTETLLCFSHLRWDFVYQRPQHLISRFAKQYTVYFIEEPELRTKTDGYHIKLTKENVKVVTPHLKDDTEVNKIERLKNIIDAFIKEQQIKNYISWYYSPMA